MKYIIITALTFISVINTGLAQDFWEKVPIPDSVICYDIAFDTAGKQYIATDYGVYFSDDGTNWVLSTLTKGGTIIYINENNTIYAACGAMPSLFRSFDNSITWDSLFCGDGGFASISTFGDSCIFTGGWGGIYRSIDSALTWQLVLDTYSSEVFNAIEKTSDNILFAGSTAFITGTTLGGVYRSEDNGETWVSSGLDYHFVWSMGINSLDEIYVGTVGNYTTGSSKVFNSIDNGNTWDIVFEGNRVNTLDINNYNEIAIGCRTDGSYGGVYLSTDKGETWEDVTNNLPSRAIFKVKFNDDSQLYAIVSGSGLFKTTTPVSVPVLTTNSVKIFPNPVQDEINVCFEDTGISKIIITDIMGKYLTSIALPGNQDQITVNTAKLTPGIYFLVMYNTEGQYSIQKFVKQ